MGCASSKIRKKPKEWDTHSQDGACETANERQAAADDQLLSQHNTSVLQATGMPVSDGLGQAPSIAVKDSKNLEIPVPRLSVKQEVDAAADPLTKKTVEDVAGATAKLDDALDSTESGAELKSEEEKMPGNRASSGNIESSSGGIDETTSTVSSHADGHRCRNEKKGRHRRQRGRAGESVSECELASLSLRHGDAKKRKKNKKKSRRSKVGSPLDDAAQLGDSEERFDECSLSASSQERQARKQSSTILKKEPSTNERARPQTRYTSASSNSLSIDFESNAAPSVMPVAQHSVAGESAAVSSTSRSGGGGGSRGHAIQSKKHGNSREETSSRPRAEDFTVNAPENMGDAGAQQYKPSLLSATVGCISPPSLLTHASGAAPFYASVSRIPYEPYSDFGAHEGDSLVPPYEWVPRTMPVSSLLRQRETAHLASVNYAVSDQEAARDMYLAAAPFAADAASPLSYRDEAPRSHHDDAVARMAHFHDPAVSDNDGGAPPLAPRTFYPRLPPVQWPPYTTPPPQPSYTGTVSAASPSPPDGNVEGATRASVEECPHDDTHPLFSPADALDNGLGRELRKQASTSLIDAYVSDGDVALRHHRGEGYVDYSSAPPPSSSYYPPPRISILPSPYAYGPSPMVSAASVGGNTGRDAYAGQVSSSRLTNDRVSAHQYKPVTYLFDNPMDDWLQRRRAAAPQRELYAGAADLW
ncbi:hypothetical protein ABL78_5639 [Leptomonas seymouri]|uniref:Uncharacterized protein n=1 Tax=Leptomonas seymouri TaxID=5684 RepID=A0A0N0P4H4_LEPSE|nr:hypothetical protein ABL78_5639 [Leptomonas seymouri]|eukprot:KPI85299.1 hypothetical protein ABL78_5639 [Leptomonas seymouri]